MSKTSKALRSAALVASSVVGQFGATKDNAPEAFQDELTIERAGGGGKGKGRRSSLRPAILKPGEFKTSRYAVSSENIIESRRFWDQRYSKVVGSMRGSEWLKENRRLRSAGLPENRI